MIFKVELSPFDPNAIEMVRLVAEGAGALKKVMRGSEEGQTSREETRTRTRMCVDLKPLQTHFYPMALATHNIFPPPATVGGAIGEVSLHLPPPPPPPLPPPPPPPPPHLSPPPAFPHVQCRSDVSTGASSAWLSLTSWRMNPSTPRSTRSSPAPPPSLAAAAPPPPPTPLIHRCLVDFTPLLLSPLHSVPLTLLISAQAMARAAAKQQRAERAERAYERMKEGYQALGGYEQ
eukprot:762812-Hanusia_phi.AAC.7